MALFRRQREGLRVSPYHGDQEAPLLEKELHAGGFEATHAALAAAPPHDRAVLLHMLPEAYHGRLQWLDPWIEAQPASAIPLTFRGMHHVMLAWRARGSDRAESVKRRGWKTFVEHLEHAEADLARAAEIDPDDPAPWTGRVLCARGLELDIDALLRRWQEVEQRAPGLQPAARHVLQGLAEKWGGSHGQMFEFARTQSAAAPDGSPMHTLVAEAHIERWLHYAGFEEDEDAAETYLIDPAVRDELRAAAQRSVASPAWAAHRWEVMERNTFAMALGMAGDPSACEQFAAIGDRVTPEPWEYFGDPATEFVRLRDEVGG